MVEKNSGVPPLNEVVAPVLQPEQTENNPDVGTTTPHAKRHRKSKIKPDAENDTVAGKDAVNAEQSNIPAILASGDNPAHQLPAATATGENKDSIVAEAVENKAIITDQKRKHKRPRPLPPIEHKRVVHYYKHAKPVKKKDRRRTDNDRDGNNGSRNRDDGYAKKSKYDDRDYSSDDDDDDDEELLSYNDWDVDSGDDSDSSDGDSDNDEPVKNRESGQDKRRDDGGRFAPVHAVMQYRVV
jgi:hypothetical protein